MSIAGASRSANGSLPNFSLIATHDATAPGTLTESQPRAGGVAALAPCLSRKYCGVHAAGAGPDALRPCSLLPSHRMQNESEPRPLLHGSTIVITAAAAIAASTALPPLASMRRPACAPSGCDVDTMLRANTGRRGVG